MADGMHQKYLVLAVVSLWPISGVVAAQRPIGAADTLAVKNIGEVAPSPDGRTIMFALGTIDLAANKTLEQLMRIQVGGGEPEPVKGTPEGAGSIRWSPDGSRIAFIAKADRGNAIYTLEVASEKLTRVCDYARSNGFLAHSGNMLAWSPDGQRIAFAGIDLDPFAGTQIGDRFAGQLAVAGEIAHGIIDVAIAAAILVLIGQPFLDQ